MKMQSSNSDSNSNLNSKTEMTKHEQLDCPRCGSNDTKFCYYNNYNTSQPRHLCKNCRRYWTKGGALRNVPIGGSTRKKCSKRPSKKHLAEPAVSAPAVKDTASHSQPVTKMMYQPVIAPDLSGYFGKFNLSAPGLPLAVTEMQSLAQSSAGQNEIFFLNGPFLWWLAVIELGTCLPFLWCLCLTLQNEMLTPAYDMPV